MDTLLNGLIWLGALVACGGIFVVWNLTIFAILRSFGVDAHFRLGRRRVETNSALRRLGVFNYVLIEGILLFGWPFCMAFAAFEYITRWTIESPRVFRYQASGAHLLRDFVLWTVGGILYGLVSWRWDKPEDVHSEPVR